MVHYEEQEVDFYQVDQFVLKTVGISSEGQFKNISDKLFQAFVQASEKI